MGFPPADDPQKEGGASWRPLAAGGVAGAQRVQAREWGRRGKTKAGETAASRLPAAHEKPRQFPSGAVKWPTGTG